ncbi:SWR1-complex protein 4 [Coniochaeta hoffmannii]|uniref:SWR1-complex protein 4 n=1 Tax=Coniochaeta hoffmannii TaxID=91930 RepID=A0AA38RT27_9PEZI|nr:SWR1-complex protein 4 [Coniochaeta hoffmannii]
MSLDVRDVLNIPEAGPRPAKKQKTAVPRTNLKGLAREVQSLGGDNPIAIVPEVSLFKKRRFGSRKPAAKWELRRFTNSARGDNGALVLRHWRRKHEDAPHPEDQMQDVQSQADQSAESGQEKADDKPEDSTFAKFNVQVAVPQYSEDQYNSILVNDDWTKDETDYLLQMVKDFDLRWPVIWDRYEYVPRGPQTGETDGAESTAVIPTPKQRTMEDLKARYYEVAAKMMVVQKPAQYMTKPEFDLYEIMTNFNPAEERRRKEFAINTMARSKDEAREEESLLLEIKRIMARTERFNEERRELYQRLDYPHTDQDISIYKSSQGLQTLLQTLMNVDKSKKRRSLAEGAAGPTPTSAGFAAGQAGPHHPSSDGPGNRRESIAASASGGHFRRDSLVSATPATPADATPTSAADKKKKGGAAQFERRKLSDHEETIYGVSHHERLTSGPTFRYEKINKLYSHKSGQQQLRITNLLTELDVPSRLIMPTAAVTAQFEVLWAAVTTLVDLRKVSDKIEAEIKLEEAKKAERDRARGVLLEAEKKGEGEGGERAVPDSQESGGAAEDGGDAAAAGAGGGEGEQAGHSETTTVAIKDEDGGGQEKARPGSSGAHKRSASVLSAASDKSAKRQKK